jgi:hypothetical protein
LEARVTGNGGAYARELEKLQLLELEASMRDELPHIYGWPFYKWAREFYDSRNRMNLICAANQISKSSTMIRKAINWSTSPTLWPHLWDKKPLTFWYGYPTKDVATAEFEKKWVPEFLPRGKMETHSLYGWKAKYKQGQILQIDFNCGPTIFFKTYGQDVADLQTGTVWAHFMDEELPEELYSELQFRLAATDGYWHGVFTPTLGQEFWRCAIEEHGQYERFKGALKLQVSMYDCLFYEDGTPSRWKVEQILRAIAACKSEAEVQRRVFGRFVIDSGLKYPAFVRGRHFTGRTPHHVPSDWLLYVGVDPGSGGDNHPAAYCLLAVRPDFQTGRVIGGWRGDGVVTDAGGLAKATQERVKQTKLTVGAVKYDYSCRDFYTLSQELGFDVQPAEKSHAVGEQVVNVLFRNDMIHVYDLPELEPLAVELSTLKLSTPKTKAKDDFADALRYAAVAVPWDWSVLSGVKEVVTEKELTQEDERRRLVLGVGEEMHGVDEEIAAFNELMGTEEGYGEGGNGELY